MNGSGKTSTQIEGGIITHEDALNVIGRANDDSHVAREIDKLRGKYYALVNEVVREVTVALGNGSQTAALLRSSQDTAAILCSVSRQREGQARQRRALAEAMILGVLLNGSNLDWDPMDPASGSNGGKSILLSLLMAPSLE